VLRSPTPHQRAVLEEVARAADAVVVMTEAGRRLLVGGFDVDATKVVVMTEAGRRVLVGGFDVDTTKVVVVPHGAAGTAHNDER
jgi:hypothetical protein